MSSLNCQKSTFFTTLYQTPPDPTTYTSIPEKSDKYKHQNLKMSHKTLQNYTNLTTVLQLQNSHATQIHSINSDPHTFPKIQHCADVELWILELLQNLGQFQIRRSQFSAKALVFQFNSSRGKIDEDE